MPRHQQQMQVDQASLSASLACQSSISHIMSSPALASSAGALTMSDAAFEETSRQIMQAANVDEGDADVSEDELAQLLGQLLNEPDNDEERAAKFALYEKYSETVSNARKATLDFWAEAVAEFEGGAKTKVEDDIKKIDHENNLGFDFEAMGTRRWFVYDMAQTAHRNANTIERLLAGIRTKIELLSSQADCPICLEPFVIEERDDQSDQSQTAMVGAGANPRERETYTQTCCHKLCKPCWEHWQQVNRFGAFCPLCRQQDFLVQIMDQADHHAPAPAIPDVVPVAAPSSFSSPPTVDPRHT